MKLYILTFLVFVLELSYAQPQLIAKIATEKSTYYVTELIYCRIVLKNNLDTLIRFEDHDINRHLKIWDHNQNQLELRFEMESEGEVFLFPHNSTVIMSDIATLFGNLAPITEKTPYGLPPGEYTIQFKMNKKEIVAESKKLTITIVPPPPEELPAFNLFNEGWRKVTDRSFPRGISKLDFQKLAETYPNSVYALQALSLGTPAEQQNKAFYLNIIKVYPNHYLTLIKLRSLLSKYKSEKDKAGAENMLRDIINKLSGSLIAKEAQRKLDEIQSLTEEEWLNPELKRARRLKEYREKHMKKR